MTTVLLVEDDPAAREGLELALRRLGYGVRCAVTGEEALNGLSGAAADVVVLDVMLPGLDGLEVCRRLRRRSEVPVIMLTARGGDLDIVGGLEAGADDYVVKPVEPRVLDARIRAVLRRIVRPGSPAETHGELMIDADCPAGRTGGFADPDRAAAAAGAVGVAAASVFPRTAPRPGLGTRLPWRFPAGRCVCAAAAGQDRS